MSRPRAPYSCNASADIRNDGVAPERCNARMQPTETERRVPGYSVRTAAPGGAQVPDKAGVVIVNVYMPRHEGASKLHAVKAAYPETPLIAISGQFRPGLGGSCAAAEWLGVRRVIAKPFTRRDLLAAVYSVIGLAR